MSRILAMALLVSIATPAAAQSTKTGPTEELTALEHRWVDAMVKNDVATLDKIIAKTYTDTDEEGHQSGKADLLAVIKSGDLKFKSLTVSDMHVHVYGSAAVVTGTGAQNGAYKGQAVTPKVVFTDTFVKGKGGWMAVASHRTAIH